MTFSLLNLPNAFFTCLLTATWIVLSACKGSQPYPSSSVIDGINIDWATHERYAPGSDNWPLTWADDGHQYSSWGDGGGFGGTNHRGRVSLGVARIEGEPESYRGINILGGFNSKKASTINGKSYGIISVDGILYMWVSPGSGIKAYEHSQLHMSPDHGKTWTKADWKFKKNDGLINPTFLQFGKDYGDSRDCFIYIYANRLKDESGKKLKVQKPGEIVLMRVPKDNIFDRFAYSFFGGFDINGIPVWTLELPASIPVFYDKNGVGWATGGVLYNKGLDRYILTTEHTASRKGNLGVFDAAEPWGPWTTVDYIYGFGAPDEEKTSFYWNFSSKWMSSDGNSFSLVFTGKHHNDSWNSVRGTFLKSPIGDP